MVKGCIITQKNIAYLLDVRGLEMPGISLISTKINRSDLIDKFTKAQLIMKHDLAYKNRIFFETDHTIIGYTGYDEYPMNYWECHDYFVIQEGMIYNLSRDEVNTFVFDLVSQDRKSSISISAVKNFLFKTDGEFVLIIFDKMKKDLIILNDALGRLPLYYCADNQKFVLSREIKFITKFMAHINLDKLAVAEYLLFGYPLGTRTLIDNVNKLDPAVLLKYDIRLGRLEVKKAYVWNLESKTIGNESPKEYVENLVTLFRNAIKSRVESLKRFRNIVTLSGGLDSRAVSIGLREIDPKLTAVTFLDYEKKSSDDVNVVQKLVQKFHINWKLVELKKRDLEDMRRLIELKDGLNYAAMGFILDFYTKIKHNFGNEIVCFNGIGGNTVLEYRAHRELKSMNELVNVIIDKYSTFKLSEVLKILDLSIDKIKKEIISVLLNYPENDLNKKLNHFVIFDRGRNFVFEGEDRDRFFFWSTNPYFSTPFFDYAVKAPRNYLRYNNLRRMLLKTLDKKSLKIRYANWSLFGRLLGPWSYYLLPRIEETVLDNAILRKIIKYIYKIKVNIKYDPQKEINNYQELDTPSSINDMFILKNVNKLLNQDLNETKFFNLITILLYAQYLQQ